MIPASMPARCSLMASTRRCGCRNWRWRTSCLTCSWSKAPAPICLRYRVEDFVSGGNIFRNLARLSAAGLPVVTVTHGSSTAGGAYQTGLSDYIVMVRGRTRAFLAGPPLLKAATGEIATEEELGGAEMHTSISGLGDYLAEDDRDALRIARDIMANLEWDRPAQARCLRIVRRAMIRKNCSASCRWTTSGRSTCARRSRASSTIPTSPNSAPITAPPPYAATPASRARRSASSPITARSIPTAPTRRRILSRPAASRARRCSISTTPPATWSAKPTKKPA